MMPWATGCQSHPAASEAPGSCLRPAALDKAGITAYFGSLRLGYPVTQIERDLDLRPSTDTQVPSSLTDYFSVRYHQHGLVIIFHAQAPVPDGRDWKVEDLVYDGNPDVCTHEEYIEALRRIGVPVAR